MSYVPGRLEAVIYDEKQLETGRSQLCSATGEYRIVVDPKENLSPDKSVIFEEISIQGENGVVEANYDCTLGLEVEGGQLLGFGSARPRTEESFVSGQYTTYYGRALAVIRRNNVDENCSLKVVVPNYIGVQRIVF